MKLLSLIALAKAHLREERMLEYACVPPGMFFLRMGEQAIFPAYGPSGGLQAHRICYLIPTQSVLKRMNGDDLGVVPEGQPYKIFENSAGAFWAAVAVKDEESFRFAAECAGRDLHAIVHDRMQKGLGLQQ